MSSVATYIRDLDPRLKLGVALILGPVLWKVDFSAVIVSLVGLLFLVWPLAVEQPVGAKMVRSLMVFVVFWVAIKMVLDAVSGVPVEFIVMDGAQLGARLVALVLLGLCLALSSSSRAIGLAISWVLRPFIGRERAWRAALSLALMVHFLPLCLEALARIREVASRRCLGSGFRVRFLVVPAALMRNLSQKTWNQTMAIACRGLDTAEAWEADFTWTLRETITLLVSVCLISGLFFL
ncbi:cobalt transporter [Pseudodesulfovibrio sp. JC047]|uniref:cobalt transporter n=1 Tax=Pseudodesulfovibrio sp. JC047 TaxID=2683199 RepID=UPI0013D70638|nr:cobalt transporter [Pseudodesulfovibrio sp. JC047]NDV19320.1 cobalt transporter [Pseudodesulfovibrio sp. JC047]